MSDFFSVVLTRNAAYAARDGDSHQKAIDRYALHVDGARGPNVAHVELRPPDAGLLAPVEEWAFYQAGPRPEWYEPAQARARIVEALVSRAVPPNVSCTNCSDCIGCECTHCIGCTRLTQREYVAYNSQLTPEMYWP